MSVALIRPNSVPELFKIYSESLALGYLSSVLRKNGVEVDIIDAYLENMNFDELLQRVAEKDYRLIGFTIFNSDSLEWTKKVAKFIKNEFPEIHIIVGGHLVSFDYISVLKKIKAIDSVVRFEGEYVLLNLVNFILNKRNWHEILGIAFRKNGHIITNDLSPLIPSLDELPFPERDYLPYLIENYKDEYTVYINRGRGCYGKCKFCSVPSFYSFPKGKIFRQRSNEHLVNEIEYLVNTYQVDYFTFIDDFFIVPSKQGFLSTISLAEEIKKRKLNILFSICERVDNLYEDIVDALISAGLIRIFLGLEAATQDIINKLGKKIDRNIIDKTLSWLLKKNIDVEISFINFLPFNSLEDVRENITYFSQWGLDILRSIGNRLEPYPGTYFFDYLKGSNNLILRGSFSYDYIKNNIDQRVDTMYEIMQPSIPYLGFLSHKIRTVKSLLRRRKGIKYNLFYDQLCLLQKTIVDEVSDLFLSLINELERQRNIDIDTLSNEILSEIAVKTEFRLSQLIEIENKIKEGNL